MRGAADGEVRVERGGGRGVWMEGPWDMQQRGVGPDRIGVAEVGGDVQIGFVLAVGLGYSRAVYVQGVVAGLVLQRVRAEASHCWMSSMKRKIGEDS